MVVVLRYSQSIQDYVFDQAFRRILLNIFILHKEQGVNVVEVHLTEKKDERHV